MENQSACLESGLPSLSQEGEPQQLSLFDLNFHSSDNISEEVKSFENSQKHEKLDQALDEIRKKFGKDAVVRASFLKSRKKRKRCEKAD